MDTLPETNVASENRISQNEIIFQAVIFRGHPVSFRQGKPQHGVFMTTAMGNQWLTARKLTSLAGKSPCLVGDVTSSNMVH